MPTGKNAAELIEDLFINLKEVQSRAGSFYIGGRVLRVCIENNIPVYYKIHRSIYFAYLCEESKVSEARGGQSRTFHRAYQDEPHWPLHPNIKFGVDPSPSIDEQRADESLHPFNEADLPIPLRYLRLSNNEVDEVLSSGSCVIDEFCCGGLGKVILDEAGVDKTRSLVEVNFSGCFLIKRDHWYKNEADQKFLFQEYRDFKTQIEISERDLYILAKDLDSFRSVQASKFIKPELCPVITEDKPEQCPVCWLVWASVAVRDKVVHNEATEIKAWLIDNAKSIFRKKWGRSMGNVVIRDKPKIRGIDEDFIKSLPRGEDFLHLDHSKNLNALLAIANWWVTSAEIQEDRSPLKVDAVYRLYKMFGDAGFKLTVRGDLTEMLSKYGLKSDSMIETFRSGYQQWCLSK